jgi:hypothetical protein
MRGWLVALSNLLVACSFDVSGVRVNDGDGGNPDAFEPPPDAAFYPDAPPGCEPVPEICNGADEDCDGIPDDGLDVGEKCDGDDDDDECADGFIYCAGGSVYCSDDALSTVEVCNDLDDDCDGDTDEDWNFADDVDNCGGCGIACENALGSTSCVAGFCQPDCDLGYADCDGDPIAGCDTLLDTNPMCPTSTTDDGVVSGDTPSPMLVLTGFGEEWYRIQIDENDNSLEALQARFTLTSAPDSDFDLYVYCFTCGNGDNAESVLGPGEVDVVDIGRPDEEIDATYHVLVEVRYASNALADCGGWTLTVQGDVGTATNTCELF